VTPPPPAAGCRDRVPDAARVALRPIDYARNDKRRKRIGLRRWFSSLVRRCVGSRSIGLHPVPFVRPSVRAFPLLALLPFALLAYRVDVMP
jgi:hypothetical protein